MLNMPQLFLKGKYSNEILKVSISGLNVCLYSFFRITPPSTNNYFEKLVKILGRKD